MNSGNDERLYLHHRLSAFHTGIPCPFSIVHPAISLCRIRLFKWILICLIGIFDIFLDLIHTGRSGRVAKRAVAGNLRA